MIQKHLKNGFLFPPVITKKVIDKTMLSPFMKQLMTRKGKIDKKVDASPIQTYHDKNKFVMTPILQFYMEMGIQISNITEVIQYVPGKGLLPFANRVVQLRSEATDEGDDAKQLTAKLFGNAGEYTIRTCNRTCTGTCHNICNRTCKSSCSGTCNNRNLRLWQAGGTGHQSQEHESVY